jgi:hypothetical protein
LAFVGWAFKGFKRVKMHYSDILSIKSLLPQKDLNSKSLKSIRRFIICESSLKAEGACSNSHSAMSVPFVSISRFSHVVGKNIERCGLEKMYEITDMEKANEMEDFTHIQFEIVTVCLCRNLGCFSTYPLWRR